jgi:short-subunit dehydrogenase
MVSKMSLPGLSGYASTKSALNMISQTARGELAPENIRVITVFPRSTSTRFRENAIGDIGATQPRRGGAIVIDPPETVADKILSAMVSEIPEQYMDAAG